MISPEIRRELLAVDWNFPQMFDGAFRTQHWYPGTFPTEMPATLIQALTRQGDLVFDPYAGIGTTATEALRLGRRSWTVELNRTAALATYVSGAFVLLKRMEPRMVDVLLSALECLIGRFEGGQLFQLDAVEQVSDDINDLLGCIIAPAPEFFLNEMDYDGQPNQAALERWFHRKTLGDLLRFSDILDAETSGILKMFGKMCISACLRPLSSQTRSWGHVADNVFPKWFQKKPVSYALRRWLGRFGSNIRRTGVRPIVGGAQPDSVALHVSVRNWLNSAEDLEHTTRRIALLLTSPPYGGAIDYVLSQRLSYYYFGATDEDLYADQRNEIGARRKRSRRISRDLWADELSAALRRQASYVDKSGSIVIIMPHKSEGRGNGNRIVDETLEEMDWRNEMKIDRSIHTMRTRQAWTSIKRETVNIYTNENRTNR